LLKKLLSYLLLLLFVCSYSQTKKRNFIQREIGVFAGGAYYIGDLNPRGHFGLSQRALGAFYRYSTHYRYAFRFGFNSTYVIGDDSKSIELDQLERNLYFKSKIYDFNAVAEFNFVEYRIGNNKHPFTMFIFGGLGGYFFDTDLSQEQGLQTEKIHGGVSTKKHPLLQINVPFGVGFKLNIGKKFGISLEWSPRKLFTDYLDEVSLEYNDGYMRGNPRTKDWYFLYGGTLTFKLPDIKKPCHGNGFE
jgi:hypothetical protein